MRPTFDHLEVPHDPETTNVNFHFHDCDAGWIHLTVSAGSVKRQINLSHGWDPFPDFMACFESICCGVEQCSFIIDEEGRGTRINFERFHWHCFQFTISDFESSEVLLQCYVIPFEFVKSFYYSMHDFAFSDQYIKSEWSGPAEDDWHGVDLPTLRSKLIEDWIDNKQHLKDQLETTP